MIGRYRQTDTSKAMLEVKVLITLKSYQTIRPIIIDSVSKKVVKMAQDPFTAVKPHDEYEVFFQIFQ